MHNFRELDVWKKSMDLTTTFYKISKNYPKEELFGLTSQSRRCLISIPSNIAEGAGRDSDKQFVQFLNISLASSFELETQIIIAHNLEYLSIENNDRLLSELKHIQNMLVKLIKNYKI